MVVEIHTKEFEQRPGTVPTVRESQGEKSGNKKVRESQGIVRKFGIVPKVREFCQRRSKSQGILSEEIFFQRFCNDFYQISLAM